MTSVSLPGLGISDRPALFRALNEEFSDGIPSIVSADLGGSRGWIVGDASTAVQLLRSPNAVKGRPLSSLKLLGGYTGTEGNEFVRRRRGVVRALVHASRDDRGMSEFVTMSGSGDNERVARYGSDALAATVLGHLSGSSSRETPGYLVKEAVDGILNVAESATGAHYKRVSPSIRSTRNDLHSILTEIVSEHRSVFTRSLVEQGWSDQEVADEIIALVVAGWSSLTAMVCSGLTVGIGPDPTESQLDELLRLSSPSWLIARRLVGTADCFPGGVGDLVVVSPWLLHRDPRVWAQPGTYLRDRFARRAVHRSFLPFGAGSRRCPAEAYAKAQARCALRSFGPSEAWGGEMKVELIAGRSAALVRKDG